MNKPVCIVLPRYANKAGALTTNDSNFWAMQFSMPSSPIYCSTSSKRAKKGFSPIYRSRENLERRIQFQVPTHRMGAKTQSRYRICTDRDHRRPRQQPRIPITSPARRYIRWDRNRILQKRIAAKCSTHSAQPNPQRQKLSAIGISHSGEWE